MRLTQTSTDASYEAVAAGFRGQTLIAGGNARPGVKLLRTALPRLHADRYELYASAFVSDLSLGLADPGQIPDAMIIPNEAIARATPEGDDFEMPELRGELEAQSGNIDGAEATLLTSIALSERQERCPGSCERKHPLRGFDAIRADQAHWMRSPTSIRAFPRDLGRLT